MKRKVYVSMLLATMMVLSSSFTVCAEDVCFSDGQDHVVSKDVEGVVLAENDTNITVNGDVDSKNRFNSTILSEEDSKVQVNGNVSSGFIGVCTNEGSATVTGNVSSYSDKNSTFGVDAMNGAQSKVTVVVDGNVTSKSDSNSAVGVFANMSHEDGAQTDVIIGGSVDAKGKNGVGGAVALGDGSNINIKGDLTVEYTGDDENGSTGNNAIEYDKGSVIVDGNVNATNAAGILPDTRNSGKAYVGGTLSVDDDNFAIIINSYSDSNNYNYDITVGEIDAKNYVGVWSIEESKYIKASDTVTDKLMHDGVSYIIKCEDTQNGSTTVDGTGIAKEGDKLIVNVVASDGYEVKGVEGGKAAVTQNSDGTYTVIVPRGGGVNIKAIIEEIIRKNSDNVSTTATNTINQEPAAEQIKYNQIVDQTKNSIVTAASTGNVVVDFGKFTTINKALVKAMASRSDVAYTFRYMYKGQLYQMTIPAGTDLSSYLDANGFCGILYLGTVFPATKVA